jgi:hypothetical protein
VAPSASAQDEDRRGGSTRRERERTKQNDQEGETTLQFLDPIDKVMEPRKESMNKARYKGVTEKDVCCDRSLARKRMLWR